MERSLGGGEGTGSRVKEKELFFNRRLFIPPLGLEEGRGKMGVNGGVCGFDGQTWRKLLMASLLPIRWEGGHLYQWTAGLWSVCFTAVTPDHRPVPDS